MLAELVLLLGVPSLAVLAVIGVTSRPSDPLKGMLHQIPVRASTAHSRRLGEPRRVGLIDLTISMALNIANLQSWRGYDLKAV